MIVTDLETWLLDYPDRIFRMWEYRRVGDWTPLEIEKKYIDQSNLVDNICEFIKIEEAITLPDGDVLIGCYFTDELPFDDNDTKYMHYVKLSNIKLAYYENDQHIEEED